MSFFKSFHQKGDRLRNPDGSLSRKFFSSSTADEAFESGRISPNTKAKDPDPEGADSSVDSSDGA